MSPNTRKTVVFVTVAGAYGGAEKHHEMLEKLGAEFGTTNHKKGR